MKDFSVQQFSLQADVPGHFRIMQFTCSLYGLAVISMRSTEAAFALLTQLPRVRILHGTEKTSVAQKVDRTRNTKNFPSDF